MEILSLDLIITEKIQTLFQNMTPLMKFISLIGEPPLYLIFILFLVWFHNYKTGARLALIVSFAAAIQSVTKLIFRQPRPFLVSDKIIEIAPERGFGFPSGHALVGTAFYVFIMHEWKNILGWTAGIILILLMGISRICLGAHSFFQVVAGWILGIAVVLCYFYLEKKMNNIFSSLSRSKQIVFAVILCIALVAFTLPSSFIIGKMTFTQFLWEGEMGLPIGLFLGFSVGIILFTYKRISISMKVNWKSNIIKSGILILSVITFISAIELTGIITDKNIAGLSIFGLSILFGIWGMYLGPILFLKWGLIIKE